MMKYTFKMAKEIALRQVSSFLDVDNPTRYRVREGEALYDLICSDCNIDDLPEVLQEDIGGQDDLYNLAYDLNEQFDSAMYTLRWLMGCEDKDAIIKELENENSNIRG